MLRNVVKYFISNNVAQIKQDWGKWRDLCKQCDNAANIREDAYRRVVVNDADSHACFCSHTVFLPSLYRDNEMDVSRVVTMCRHFKDAVVRCGVENIRCPYFFKNHAYVNACQQHDALVLQKRAFWRDRIMQQK